MAGLNIAERRLAQDGRIRLRLSDRELDMRVSITPTLHGESVVLRVLDRGAGVRDLAELGMPGPVLDQFEHLIRQPHGILLVTGPTGSGKTTTLYGALDRLNQPGVKIVTVEDPVEYQVAGVTQIPVNPKIGLTFAAALRSILRHDPDIIMVGEMRDRETAEIAIQAALTGHLVFSTLHTNDAPSGVTRMVDMGVEPYLVAATVLGILGQRLVRVVCDACAEDFRPPADVVAQAAAGQPGIPKPRFRRGRGCGACAGTGYRGRPLRARQARWTRGARPCTPGPWRGGGPPTPPARGGGSAAVRRWRSGPATPARCSGPGYRSTGRSRSRPSTRGTTGWPRPSARCAARCRRGRAPPPPPPPPPPPSTPRSSPRSRPGEGAAPPGSWLSGRAGTRGRGGGWAPPGGPPPCHPPPPPSAPAAGGAW